MQVSTFLRVTPMGQVQKTTVIPLILFVKQIRGNAKLFREIQCVTIQTHEQLDT